LLAKHAELGIELVGPLKQEGGWQHETGYGVSAFQVDWDKQQVRCPQGHLSQNWCPGRHNRGYERGWSWVAPGGSMVRIAEEMQARFQRQDLREGWESEDRHDSELLIERWSHGELFDEEESTPPRAGNGLVILARDGRGKIAARILGTRTTNKLQGALTTTHEVLQTNPPAVRREVHLFEGYESPSRGKPLAVFSLADRADDEEDEL
jgi:hypothetical protein